MKTLFRMFVAAVVTLSITACGTSEVDPCQSSSNPTECRQWGDAGGDINDYLVGGMIGYMLANRGGHTVIVQDRSYRGPVRTLRRPIPAESAQISRLKAKVERQKAELRRQQAANARKSAELKAYKPSSTSSYKPSSYSYRPSTSYRPSYRPSFKSGKY